MMKLPELALPDPARRGAAGGSVRLPRSADADGTAAGKNGAIFPRTLYPVGSQMAGEEHFAPSKPFAPAGTPRSQPSTPRRHRVEGLSARTNMLTMSGADKEAERRLAAERNIDSFVTSVSKETLLSEQYAKELSQTRERIKQLQLQLGPRAGNSSALHEALSRNRGRLIKRVTGMETRMNELEKYNEKLVATINAMRKAAVPHHQGMKRSLVMTQKRHADLQGLKTAATKALDERDRFKAQMRVLREEAAQERNHFAKAVSNSDAQLDELDVEYSRVSEDLDASAEAAKKSQFLAMKAKRATRERLDVKYGYLRSQLEAIDGEFRKLEHIVGVHFAPADPASLMVSAPWPPPHSRRRRQTCLDGGAQSDHPLPPSHSTTNPPSPPPIRPQLIINKFAEKEAHTISLQQFWAQQNGDLEATLAEIARLEAVSECP